MTHAEASITHPPMPPRFVEVLDVASEASGAISQLLQSGSDLASDLRINISSYINATTSEYDFKVVGLLFEKYNLTADRVIHVLSSLNLTESAMPTVPPPNGVAGWLMMSGLLLLCVRSVLVRVLATRFVKRYGHGHRD